jgi:hypothetical protein
MVTLIAWPLAVVVSAPGELGEWEVVRDEIGDRHRPGGDKAEGLGGLRQTGAACAGDP